MIPDLQLLAIGISLKLTALILVVYSFVFHARQGTVF